MMMMMMMMMMIVMMMMMILRWWLWQWCRLGWLPLAATNKKHQPTEPLGVTLVSHPTLKRTRATQAEEPRSFCLGQAMWTGSTSWLAVQGTSECFIHVFFLLPPSSSILTLSWSLWVDRLSDVKVDALNLVVPTILSVLGAAPCGMECPSICPTHTFKVGKTLAAPAKVPGRWPLPSFQPSWLCCSASFSVNHSW